MITTRDYTVTGYNIIWVLYAQERISTYLQKKKNKMYAVRIRYKPIISAEHDLEVMVTEKYPYGDGKSRNIKYVAEVTPI